MHCTDCQDHVANLLLAQLGPHYPPNKDAATCNNDPLVLFFAGGPGIGKTWTSEALLPKALFDDYFGQCSYRVDVRAQRHHVAAVEKSMTEFVEKHPRGLILVDDAQNMFDTRSDARQRHPWRGSPQVP
jgi:hypothetical protein